MDNLIDSFFDWKKMKIIFSGVINMDSKQ